MYNPKKENFHRKPLNKGVTHEHIIHITDSDKECDYLCNILLNNLPCYFENKMVHNISIPWHIQTHKTCTIMNIDINTLNVKLIHKNKCDIIETPHYKYINNDKIPYINYYSKYLGTCLQDNHSYLQFDNLISTFNPEQYNFEETRLIITNTNYRVLDGVHRLCILKKNNINTIKIAVLT